MIWAQDRNGILGAGGNMLWHVPADFKRFKATTMSHPIVMGRKSWQSIGSRPLPGRTNIVITSNPSFEAGGAIVCPSLQAALHKARQCPGGEQIWITGGGQVYTAALDLAEELVVTKLDLDVSDKIAQWPAAVYAPRIGPEFVLDQSRSDSSWREASGDARWKVEIYRRLHGEQ